MTKKPPSLRLCQAATFVAGLAFLATLLAASPASAGSKPRSQIRVGPDLFLTAASDVALPNGSPDAPESRATPQREPRIVGGYPTKIQEWPWQTALTLHPAVAPGSAYDRAICGGSLVAPTIVITAAHCVLDEDGGIVDPGFYAMVTGRTQLSSSAGQEISVEAYYLVTDENGVPLYDPISVRWDVAVVELASPSSSSSIRIAGADEPSLWSAGQPAYITGWGSLLGPDGPYPDTLQAARVSIISDSACGSFVSYGGEFHSDVMVCAGVWEGGRDSCSGDSGGPLVVPTAAGGYRLVGDTSFGVEQCAVAYLPGIYGRLAGDPMRTALRDGVLQIAGVDIVGSGEQPADPAEPEEPADPPAAGITKSQALRRAWKYSGRACRRDPLCRQYWAGTCVWRGDGYRCKVINFEKNPRGRRFRCTRRVLFTAENGYIEQHALGRWSCRWGW